MKTESIQQLSFMIILHAGNARSSAFEAIAAAKRSDEALVQAKIIDNAMTFFKEVEKRGLENDLRPGTFELDSNMSLDDAIKTIFKK